MRRSHVAAATLGLAPWILVGSLLLGEGASVAAQDASPAPVAASRATADASAESQEDVGAVRVHSRLCHPPGSVPVSRPEAPGRSRWALSSAPVSRPFSHYGSGPRTASPIPIHVADGQGIIRHPLPAPYNSRRRPAR
jgi:hypothetical protein